MSHFIHISFTPFIHTSFTPFHGPLHFHFRFLNLISSCNWVLQIISFRPLFIFHSTLHLWSISFHYILLHSCSIPPYFMIHFNSFHTKFHPCFKAFYRYILQPARYSAARYPAGNYPATTCLAANWSCTLMSTSKIKWIMNTEISMIFKERQSILKTTKKSKEGLR